MNKLVEIITNNEKNKGKLSEDRVLAIAEKVRLSLESRRNSAKVRVLDLQEAIDNHVSTVASAPNTDQWAAVYVSLVAEQDEAAKALESADATIASFSA